MSTLMQWIHIMAVVLAVGGTLFVRLILLPVLPSLLPEQRKIIGGALSRRFFPLLWICVLLIVASGIYNVWEAWIFQAPQYWNLLKIKVTLAAVLFLLVFAATLPLKVLQPFHDRRPQILWINIALATVILLLSAWLRRM